MINGLSKRNADFEKSFTKKMEIINIESKNHIIITSV